MTMLEFCEAHLPYNSRNRMITSTRLFLWVYILSIEWYQCWEQQPLKKLLAYLDTTEPKEFLNLRGVGKKKIKILISALLEAGVDLDDLPTYKAWYEKNK